MESIDGSREVEGSIRMNHYNGQYISLKIFLKLKFNSLSFFFFCFFTRQPSIFRGCLDGFFSSLNFRHSISITHRSSLITHHFKIPHLFGTITYLPSFNIFHTVCRPYTYHSVQLFFFSSTQKPKLERKKKKRNPDHLNPVKEEKKRKKNLETQTQ